jgi:hypothetical protein
MSQSGAGACDIGRVHGNVVCKFHQKLFVAGKIVEDAGKELRLACRRANPFRPNASGRQEPAKPLGSPRKKGKRLNCQRFRRFSADRTGFRYGHAFAIP